MNSDRHISLGLVFHNHQPVGQSDEVFEEIYGRAYEPMVAALERHPGGVIRIRYRKSHGSPIREGSLSGRPTPLSTIAGSPITMRTR